MIVPCYICGKGVDTREAIEGGDEEGVETSEGYWLCSESCWDQFVEEL